LDWIIKIWFGMVTKMMSEITDLKGTVEKLRSVKYPDLSEDLIEAIIDIENSSLDDRKEALRKIAILINSHTNENED
jgi:hypothetical protein